MTFGALFQVALSVFVSAVHATVAVVINRAIADVVFVHEVNDVGNSLWIVSGIAVDFYVEDVSTACELVVWSFNFCFVARRALVVDGHVV